MLQKRSKELFCINNALLCFPFYLLDARISMEDYILVGIVLMLLFVLFFYLLILQFYKRRIAHQKEMDELASRFEKVLLQSQLEIQEQTFKNIRLVNFTKYVIETKTP